MSFLKKIKTKAVVFKNYALKASLKKKIIFLVIFVGLGIFTRQMIVKSQKNQVTYETAQVEKGALINSISASGTITSGNYTNISTKVSGVVKKVYVTNGDKVVKGQKIAEVTLDEYAQERQTATWVAYLEATEAVKDAQTAKVTADIDMWEARQNLLDAETHYKDMVAGAWNTATNKEYTYNEEAIVTKEFEEAKLKFTAAESKYLNSESDISNKKAKVSSALRDYQQNSAIIVSPAAGIVNDLALAEGITVSANSTTSTISGATIVSTQTVGKINDSEGQLIATVTVSEIDVLSLKANQKVTLTLDAYEDKSFTGKVLAVNTSGNVSSGVTSYPVTILLDSVEVDIYPNMAVSAEIITNLKTDVLLVPNAAVTTIDGQSTVQIRKDGQISTVQVEIGDTNDSQTEIKSGLSEGDEVVTAVITSNSSSQNNNTTSPFSGVGGSTGGSSSRSSGGNMMPGGPPGGF
jgi:multidrug efflux pump subunit AcrA (membrane-fusion protein)